MNGKPQKIVRYDPDEFVLDKQMLLGIIKGIKDYWKLHRMANMKLIMSMNLFEIWIRTQSDSDVRNIWTLMIKFIDQIRYRNAIQISENNGEKWGSVLKLTESFNELTDKKEIRKSIWGV